MVPHLCFRLYPLGYTSEDICEYILFFWLRFQSAILVAKLQLNDPKFIDSHRDFDDH